MRWTIIPESPTELILSPTELIFRPLDPLPNAHIIFIFDGNADQALNYRNIFYFSHASSKAAPSLLSLTLA